MPGLLEIPGYLEAVSRERLIRDAAYLAACPSPVVPMVTERIGTFDVLPITLRHYVILRMKQNPLLYGKPPDPAELAELLWVLSPGWVPDAKARDKWMRKHCKRMVPPCCPKVHLPWFIRRWESRFLECDEFIAETTDAAVEYITEAFQDRPPGLKSSGFIPEYYSDAAFYIDLFGEAYGWPIETTLSIPLKALFQQLKRIVHRNSPKAIMFNPSDRIPMDYTAKLNANLN